MAQTNLEIRVVIALAVTCEIFALITLWLMGVSTI